MAERKSKDVATKDQNTAMAVYDYGDYAGAGFEDTTQDDFTVPFLDILQGLSPEVETLDGAKPGKIINKATQDLYDGKDGIRIIPVHRQHVFVEWVPKDEGGGLVAVHDEHSDVVKAAKADGYRFGVYKMENGHELVETFYMYWLVVTEDGGAQPVLVPFSSTKIKKYKALMTKANTVQMLLENGKRINPPLFAHVYRAKTVKEKNNKGEYWNWEIGFDGGKAEACRLAPSDDLFQQAVQFREMVQKGEVKADYASQQQESGGGNAGGDGAPTREDGKPAF